jgi:hypothetical protein
VWPVNGGDVKPAVLTNRDISLFDQASFPYKISMLSPVIYFDTVLDAASIAKL